MEQLERIGDQHLLHTFLQNSEQHHDWDLERLFLHRMTHIDQQEPSTAGDKVEVAQKEYILEPHSHQEPSTLNVGEQLMEVISFE